MLGSVLTVVLLSQVVNPWLEQARASMREARFAEALETLAVARQVPSLDRVQRAEVLELLARCHVARGDRAQAEEAFTELLSREPDFELDRKLTSPKIVEVFDVVKRRLYPPGTVSLVEVAGPPGRVLVEVVDPYRRVASARLFERRAEGEWSQAPLAVAVRTLDFPLPVSAEGAVRWYVELLDAAGAAVASLGSRAQPRLVEVNALPPPQPPATGAPALKGTTIAALVTGAVALIAGGIGLGLKLDSLALERSARDAEWADTARATQRQASAQSQAATGLFVGAGAAAVGSTVLFVW
ncbi:MAG: tetratricopeptide repeat protein [Myxococcaceae bacterium]|nr:tetratricopeptide repeat protein [Myxococcaceae bacterium]